MCSGGVGDEGMEVNSVAECHLETNTKYLSIIFAITWIVFSLKHCGTRLLWIPVQSLIESPGTVVSTSFQDFWGAQQLRTGCLSIFMFLAPLAEVTP